MVAEAMAAGVPSGFDWNGYRDLVRDGTTVRLQQGGRLWQNKPVP